MNLITIFSDKFNQIISKVEQSSNIDIYDFGINTDKFQIFQNMPFHGVNPPQNTSFMSYITVLVTKDDKVITKSYLQFPKSSISINDVKSFLENEFADSVYIITPFHYKKTGKEVPLENQKINFLYCTLVNFCY